MRNSQQVPGCIGLGEVETLLRRMEATIGMSQETVSAEQYWLTVREFACAVPLTPTDDGDLTDEQKDAVVSRILGCSKTVFISRIKTRMRQRRMELAKTKTATERMRNKVKKL
jgi:hypothetical protein